MSKLDEDIERYRQRRKNRIEDKAINAFFKRRKDRLLRRGKKPETSQASDGGPGSGNFGHEGRLGEIGGSAPSNETTKKISATPPQGIACQAMTKKRYNEKIVETLEKGTDEEKKKAVKELLDTLPVGSEIRLPNHWNDSGVGDKLIKEKDGQWHTSDHGPWGYGLSQDELEGYFVQSADNESERPRVSKVAMTDEEKEKYLKKWSDSYWRNQDNDWKHDGSFTEEKEIRLWKADLDHCGEGFEVVGSDGRTYVKSSGGWYDSETYAKADMRKLNNAKFKGDFYDVNFGMNGVSKEGCAKLRERMSSMDDRQRTVYEKQFREGTFAQAQQGCSYYSGRTDTIYFDGDSDDETVIHELSHRVDVQAYPQKKQKIEGLSTDVDIRSASKNIDCLTDYDRESDFEAMAKVVGFETDGQGWFGGKHGGDSSEAQLSRVDTYFNFAHQYRDVPGFSAVSDMISALTEDQCGGSYVYGGHSASYWMQPYGGDRATARAQEYWAEYCTLRACGYTEALELAKKVTPKMYAAAESTYDEVFKDEEQNG